MPGSFFGCTISGCCIFLGLQYEATSYPHVMYTVITPWDSCAPPEPRVPCHSSSWLKEGQVALGIM